jgi:hypothetical protein
VRFCGAPESFPASNKPTRRAARVYTRASRRVSSTRANSASDAPSRRNNLRTGAATASSTFLGDLIITSSATLPLLERYASLAPYADLIEAYGGRELSPNIWRIK